MLCTEKYIKRHTKTINLKYLGQCGIKKFDLPDESYFASDIQDYF